MPKKHDGNLIVALDIGTSKVLAIVAEVLPDGNLDVIGIGKCLSTGLRKGVVVNIDSTVRAVQKAVEEAELMAGCQIHSVYTGISGSHIRSFNSHGIVAIKDREVMQSDVDRVIEAAKAVAIPTDQRIIHIIPREFKIDGQEGIKDPVGMSGIRLETDIHVVTGSISVAQNIVNCIRRCNLDVDDMILQQLASSEAILTEDEKRLGVCMIDIGGGTSDVAVYIDGSLRHTAVLPIGGTQVTHDIAVALRTSTEHAEQLKVKHGVALEKVCQEEDEYIDVPNIGENKLQKVNTKVLAKVVEPRMEELFVLVRNELRRVGLDSCYSAGVVLSGGSSKISGLVDLAEEVFQSPARVAAPMGVTGLTDVIGDPGFATAVGLLKYSAKSRNINSRASAFEDNFRIKYVFNRIKNWFQGNG